MAELPSSIQNEVHEVCKRKHWEAFWKNVLWTDETKTAYFMVSLFLAVSEKFYAVRVLCCFVAMSHIVALEYPAAMSFKALMNPHLSNTAGVQAVGQHRHLTTAALKIALLIFLMLQNVLAFTLS